MYKNNQKETEKAVELAKAQAKIQEFLRHSYSYTELMTMAAKAQAQVFNILHLCEPDKREECVVTEVAEFFYFAIAAFELLKPFDPSAYEAV